MRRCPLIYLCTADYIAGHMLDQNLAYSTVMTIRVLVNSSENRPRQDDSNALFAVKYFILFILPYAQLRHHVYQLFTCESPKKRPLFQLFNNLLLHIRIPGV